MSRVQDYLPATFVVACLILGGSSADGALVNLALQVVAALVAAWLLVRAGPPMVGAERQLLTLAALFVAVAAVQAVPLPAAVWSAMPGRDVVADGFNLLGAPLPVLSLSLWQGATIASAAAVLVPVAVVLLVSRASSGAIRYLAWGIVIAAALSFMVGFAQLTQGPKSALYFYTVTNRDQTVGFFANSNHLATLGVIALPFIAALGALDPANSELTGKAGRWVILIGLFVLVLLGIAIDGSVAGLMLMVPSLAGSFFIFRGGRMHSAVPIAAVLAVVVIGSFVALAFYSPQVSGFAQTDLSVGTRSRTDILLRTLEAARTFAPFGSGLGTFPLVYPLFEDPATVESVYVNHAHNDYAEFVLETGIAGLALLVLFGLWWLRSTIGAWRRAGPGGSFARAASIATLLVMMHSVVDYPGRTAAIAAVFAACCAIMARPIRSQATKAKAAFGTKARHASADSD